jgi:hypothetical protein
MSNRDEGRIWFMQPDGRSLTKGICVSAAVKSVEMWLLTKDTIVTYFWQQFGGVMAEPSPPSWLMLIHQNPPKPDAFRVNRWRRLQQVAAVAVKLSVA